MLKISGPNLVLMHDRMIFATLKARSLFTEVGSMAIRVFVSSSSFRPIIFSSKNILNSDSIFDFALDLKVQFFKF